MAQVRTGTSWKPISEAPKDGRWILGRNKINGEWVYSALMFISESGSWENWHCEPFYPTEFTEIPLANENPEAQRLINRILERQ